MKFKNAITAKCYNQKITDITYNEIISRIRKNLIATKTLFRKADKSFNQDGKILKNLEEFKSFYPMPKINIEDSLTKMKKKIDEFISNSNIEIISSENASINEVFEQYFNLKKPFGEGQKKSEFPDAFTINSIENWVIQNDKEASVLATDKDLSEYIPKSDNIYMIDSLSEYLESITEKLEQDKAKLEFLKLESSNAHLEIEWQLNKNLHDSIAYNIYDQIKNDPWKEEVEYEPAEFNNTNIVSSKVTELDDESVWVEIVLETETKMQLNYNDLSTGIYDKEDGIWFNVEHINEEKSYKTKIKLLANFDYKFTQDDKTIELNQVEFIEIIELEEK